MITLISMVAKRLVTLFSTSSLNSHKRNSWTTRQMFSKTCSWFTLSNARLRTRSSLNVPRVPSASSTANNGKNFHHTKRILCLTLETSGKTKIFVKDHWRLLLLGCKKLIKILVMKSKNFHQKRAISSASPKKSTKLKKTARKLEILSCSRKSQLESQKMCSVHSSTLTVNCWIFSLNRFLSQNFRLPTPLTQEGKMLSMLSLTFPIDNLVKDHISSIWRHSFTKKGSPKRITKKE